jgi:hypothetical protein
MKRLLPGSKSEVDFMFFIKKFQARLIGQEPQLTQNSFHLLLAFIIKGKEGQATRTTVISDHIKAVLQSRDPENLNNGPIEGSQIELKLECIVPFSL